MALFGIGDLHLALGDPAKTMDIFPGWENYVQRLEANWRRLVQPEDTVVLCGDTSWARRIEECEADFAFLHSLPGKKLLLKGNHDYWWTTANKMESFCEAKGFFSIRFLHNNAYVVDGKGIAGTRSWFFDELEAHNEKLHKREALRLGMSLEAAKKAGAEEIIAFLHYPPVYEDQRADNMLSILKEYNIKHCFYGHLHGKSCRYAFQGELEGIEFALLSADCLNFTPKWIF